MQRYYEFATTTASSSTPAPGAEIRVFLTGTSTLASIYNRDSSSGGFLKSNPFTTDAVGFYSLWAQPGIDVRITPVGGIAYTITNPSGLPNISTTGPFLKNGQEGYVDVTRSPFNAKGDNVADDTAALNAAFAVARELDMPLHIPTPAVAYKFTSTLIWDGAIDIRGDGHGSAPYRGSRLMKHGNFVGIRVTGSERVISDIHVSSKPGLSDASAGIEVDINGAGLRFSDIQITNQGGHGLHLVASSGAVYSNIQITSSGQHGLLVQPGASPRYCSVNTFAGIYILLSGGDGLRTTAGGDGCFANRFLGVTSQNNGGWNASIGDSSSSYVIYSEAGVLGDVKLESTAQHDFVLLENVSHATNKLQDNGVGSVVFNLAQGIYNISDGISPTQPGSQGTGKTIAYAGGRANGGTGTASGAPGGNAFFAGGDAAMPNPHSSPNPPYRDAVAGGNAYFTGGPGVRDDVSPQDNPKEFPRGHVLIQYNGGMTVVGSSNPSASAVSLDIQKGPDPANPGCLVVPRMTTTERDLITRVAGTLIYNTTTGQFNFRTAGGWTVL